METLYKTLIVLLLAVALIAEIYELMTIGEQIIVSLLGLISLKLTFLNN